MNNATDTELLIQYLDGELTPPENQALEQRIASDPAMQETLQNIRLTRENIRRYGIQQHVAGIRKQMLHETTGSSRIRRLPVRLSGIAAVLVLATLITLFYQYVTLTSSSLFKNNFEPFVPSSSRAGLDTLSLTAAFNNGDPARVIALFRQIEHPTPQDYFLEGNAWLSLNQPLNAMQAFLALQQENKLRLTHTFADDAEYYLAMSYLAANQTSKALEIFQKIHDTPAHLYHDRVSGWFLWKLRHVH